ncbi:MAG: serine/threonine protein kinase [Gammaproteobacteria bacterium]|nr:serine/threonine protein kinase [Gammaproteobacteria bacterium]
MPDAAPPPYANLTPDRVLDALESVGQLGDGRLLALNSYENRVYQVYMEDGPPVVAKFYRPGRWTDEAIVEEHRFTLELAERELPVVAPIAVGERTLHDFGGFRFAVYPRRGGRVPELDDPQTLQWIGRFIGRIHAIGAVRPFVHRPVFDIAGFGDEPREYLLSEGWIPADLKDAYTSVVTMALDGVRRSFDRAGPVASLRLHGDCHAGNVLWTESKGGNGSNAPVTGGPHFVDFDDCRTGPAVQDLWMLLSGERADMSRQLFDVLEGYEDFRELDPRELNLVEALRTLRLIYYSAWLARRWSDPAFPAAFPWFNTQRYWQDRILELREQIPAMEEPPLPHP